MAGRNTNAVSIGRERNENGTVYVCCTVQVQGYKPPGIGILAPFERQMTMNAQ